MGAARASLREAGLLAARTRQMERRLQLVSRAGWRARASCLNSAPRWRPWPRNSAPAFQRPRCARRSTRARARPRVRASGHPGGAARRGRDHREVQSANTLSRSRRGKTGDPDGMSCERQSRAQLPGDARTAQLAPRMARLVDDNGNLVTSARSRPSAPNWKRAAHARERGIEPAAARAAAVFMSVREISGTKRRSRKTLERHNRSTTSRTTRKSTMPSMTAV